MNAAIGDGFERANRMSSTAVGAWLRHRHRHRRHLHRYRLPSMAAPAPCRSPRSRARPPIRPSASCAASRRSSARPAPAPSDVAGLAHGTTVATNALLQGEIAGLGLIVTEGFRHILEIARQAVPEGYGNSYFWVKPERIVPLRLRARGRRPAQFPRRELRPLDEAQRARGGAVLPPPAASAPSASACIHSYANPAHERRVAEIFAEEYPDCTLSLSCDVLPEYREYERAVTTLVDAFVKPHMGRYLRRIHDELGPGLRDKPFLVMQSSGGVASAEQVCASRSPPRCRARRPARSAARWSPRSRGFPNVVTLDAGGTSTDLCLIEARQAARHQRRRGRPLPGAHPDDRHRDHRHRRRLDRLDHAAKAISRSGRAAPAPSPGRCATRTAATSRPSPTPTSCMGRIPPALIGGGIALDVGARARRARGARGAASRRDERRAARERHHRDRQLEPGATRSAR